MRRDKERFCSLFHLGLWKGLRAVFRGCLVSFHVWSKSGLVRPCSVPRKGCPGVPLCVGYLAKTGGGLRCEARPRSKRRNSVSWMSRGGRCFRAGYAGGGAVNRPSTKTDSDNSTARFVERHRGAYISGKRIY